MRAAVSALAFPPDPRPRVSSRLHEQEQQEEQEEEQEEQEQEQQRLLPFIAVDPVLATGPVGVQLVVVVRHGRGPRVVGRVSSGQDHAGVLGREVAAVPVEAEHDLPRDLRRRAKEPRARGPEKHVQSRWAGEPSSC